MNADAGEPLTLDCFTEVRAPLAARLRGLGQQAPSELSAANLWLFRRAHDYRLHRGVWPCISGRCYAGQSHAIPLFDIAHAPQEVLVSLLRDHGSLYPLTEPERKHLASQGFALSHARDDMDYLYPAAQMQHYPGHALHKKRNLIAQLLAAHTVVAEPYTAPLMTEALAVLDAWLDDKDKAPGDADDLPCREALTHADMLGLHGWLYRADGQAAGLLLAEALEPGVVVVRFAKARVSHKGMAPFMFQHAARQLAPAAQWLNFEQDLGLPNFRRTKESFQPTMLLPKWRATLA